MSELCKSVSQACGRFRREKKGYQLKTERSKKELLIEVYDGDPEERDSVMMGNVRVINTGRIGGLRVLVNDGNNPDFRNYLAEQGIESK